jgi:DNA primase
MRTADDIVERVREATNIIDVVSQYVQLRKRGRNFLGLCPFHSEKTPSFNVLEDKGIFKCFGCGAAGDVYTFLMKMEGLTFPEAIEKLASAANIPYEKRSVDHKSEESQELENLYSACKDFATYCYKALRAPSGKRALSYLTERGFREDILHRYGVGYAPDGSAFLHTKQDSKIKLTAFEKAGIVAQSDRGDYYDRFRDRIIFPIYSPTGKVIGFGGRSMPGADSKLAKYINSPETPIYQKSRVLYGLFQAKDAIRTSDVAILVEGYADVIALAQAGFQNTIAASGTSLTVDQLNLLRRYTQNIVLLFDADLAGLNAALRGIELALTAGFDVSVVILPAGEDPDSYIKHHGAEAFGEELTRKASFIEAKARIYREKGVFDQPETSAKAIRSLVETIAKVPDTIKQELYVRRIAERYKLQETTLLAELQKITNTNNKTLQKRTFAKPQTSHAPIDAIVNAFNSEIDPAEKVLLKAFLEDTSVAYLSAISLDFDFSLIQNELCRTIIMHEIHTFEESGIPRTATDVIEYFRDDIGISDLVTEVMIDRDRVSPEWKTTEDDPAHTCQLMALQSAKMILTAARKKDVEELKQKLLDVPPAEQEEIMKKIVKFSKELNALREGATVL